MPFLLHNNDENITMLTGHDPAVDGDLWNAVPTTSSSSSSQQHSPCSFDPKVFWSVNAFIFALFLGTVCWCCIAGRGGFGSNSNDDDGNGPSPSSSRLGRWLGGTLTITAASDRRARSDEAYRRAVLQRRERRARAKIQTPQQRTKKLLKSFVRNQVRMIVKEGDLIDEDPYHKEEPTATNATTADQSDNDDSNNSNNNVQDNDDNDIETGSLQESTGQLRLGNGSLVPNCCAICLNSYEVDDTVIWSSNPQCAHAFHQDCVVGWLVKMQPETPCPCCRQEFTDLERVRKESKVTWSEGNAFDMNAVSF